MFGASVLGCSPVAACPSPSIHRCLQTRCCIIGKKKTLQTSVNGMAMFSLTHPSFRFFLEKCRQKVAKDTLCYCKTCRRWKKLGYVQTSGTEPMNKVSVEGLFTEQSSTVQWPKGHWVLEVVAETQMSGTVFCVFAQLSGLEFSPSRFLQFGWM